MRQKKKSETRSEINQHNTLNGLTTTRSSFIIYFNTYTCTIKYQHVVISLIHKPENYSNFKRVSSSICRPKLAWINCLIENRFH